MVSVAGVKTAEPLVAQIDILNAAVAQLTAAISNNDTIGRITLQVFIPSGASSSTIDISYPLNLSDSTAILNDIKNVLANEVNILTNEVGAIT